MRRSEDGFTLIEVLVALVATGFLLAIIMNGALLAKDRSARAAQAREAVLLARHLVARGAARPFAERDEAGRDGALAWTLRERPLARDPRGIWVLAGLSVAINGSNGARLFGGESRKLKRMTGP